MWFEVAGVQIAWWIPPLLAFAIATVTSTGGLSGAFLLLPFQVSVLGFTSPAVTPTNHLYNVVAIPGGVYRYFREGRMLWPVTLVIIIATLPGVAVGSWLRVRYLPDPAAFKFFVGCVLLLIGARMCWQAAIKPMLVRLGAIAGQARTEETLEITPVKVNVFTLWKIDYSFSGKTYTVSTTRLFILAAVVGVIGGAYGIGGGAIIAPFLVAFFGLPVYTIAGAALASTLLTSAFAVIFFTVLSRWLFTGVEMAVSPDWMLGILFGVGGLAGTYLGARIQRFMPDRLIKAVLGVGITLLASRYIIQYF